jgi:signal peptidase II
MRMTFLKDKKIFLISVCALVFFILDRVLKYLALEEKILLVKNYNLALSINLNLPSIVILLLYVCIFVFLIYLLIKEFKKRNLLFLSFCSLIIIGLISNFIDRLKFGFVVDYINMYFFYNNLADVYIFVGVIFLLFFEMRKKNNKVDLL